MPIDSHEDDLKDALTLVKDLDLKYKAQKMREASQKINQQNQQEIVEKSNTSSENSI